MPKKRDNRNLSPPSSGSFDSSPNDDQPRPRRKRWAPKVKTGCVTCRVRRVKCDETKPHCKRCTAYGYVCDGYLTPTTCAASAAHAASAVQKSQHVRRITAALDSRQVVAESRILPPDWDFMESCRYYIETILPARQRDIDFAQSGSLNLATRHRPSFLLAMTAHRIGLISRALDTLPHPLHMTFIAPLWNLLHSSMVCSIQEINSNLEGGAPYCKVLALLRITDLLSVELTLLGTAWRAHSSGFLAVLDNCVKADIFLPPSPVLRSAAQFQVITAAIANTTSPACDQIKELDGFTLAQLADYFSVQMYGEMPCPSDLFLEMLRVTELRRLAMTGVRYDRAIAPAVRDVLNRIASFVPETWDEAYGVPDQAEFVLMARVFKCSVALYAILSLPPPSVSISEVLESWAIRKTELRQELMQLMREALGVLRSKAALCWPVAVAGVAVAEGSDEDRDLVLSTFLDSQGEPMESFYVPKHYMEKLRGFWASGKRGWEDCWDEPFAPMA
ncbi:hypothetical protein MY11210_006752 [Beauveria gryllotalpidicola]